VATEEQQELDNDLELGPIDWVILEWDGDRPRGEDVAPMIVDLVDKEIIRLIDIAFIAKDATGAVTALDLDHLGPDSAFAEFDGASSGLIDHEDLIDAGEALRPGTAAAILVWENRWAAPLGAALRRTGGQLVGTGRIPLEALIQTLEALEALDSAE
jgi:hypothetical protein